MASVPFSRNSEVCRTCLAKSGESRTHISIALLESDAEEFTIGQKISKFIPEMDFTVTPNAAICMNCLSAINFVLEFRNVCSQIEQDIQSYVQKIDAPRVELIEFVQEKVQSKQDSERIDVKEELLDVSFCNHTHSPNEADQEQTNYSGIISSSHAHLADLIQDDVQIKSDSEAIEIKYESFNDTLYDYTSTLNETKQEEEENSEMVVESIKQENLAEGESTCNLQSLELHSSKTVDYNEERQVFICNECGEQKTTKAKLILHLRKHKKQEAKDTDVKHTKSMLNKNKRNHSGGYQFQCSICEFKTEYKRSLVNHIRIDTSEKPYKCSECLNETTTAGKLQEHTRVDKGETSCKLEQWDYKTASRSCFIEHIRTHHTGEKEKPYKCSECPYKATTAGQLKIHIRRHTGETPYKCTHCDYRSAHTAGLSYHVRARHPGKKETYKCSECNYETAAVDNLKSHTRLHIGETPYECEQCDYKSAYPAGLSYHINTYHTHEKPYECSECPYKATTASQLKSHTRRHTGETPYKCTQCDYRSAHTAGLSYHIRVQHAGGTPYICKKCDYKSTSSSRLNYHVYIHHSRKKPYK